MREFCYHYLPMKNKVHLSDHFTFKKIFRFTISPILMMIFTSIYWIVDGFFISNFVGSSAFAGVNLTFPVIMIVACVGFMFGAGGSALVAKKLGQQDKEGADATFPSSPSRRWSSGLSFPSRSSFWSVRSPRHSLPSIPLRRRRR